MKMLNLVTQMKDPGAPLFTVKFPVLKQKVLLRFGEAQRRLSPGSPLVWYVEHDGNMIPGVTKPTRKLVQVNGMFCKRVTGFVLDQNVVDSRGGASVAQKRGT